jgi:hypothetical protein
MKKILNFIMILPLLGLISTYVYVLIVAIYLYPEHFYSIDPKNLPFSAVYTFVKYFAITGYLAVLLGAIVYAFDYLCKRGAIYTKVKYIYIIGVLLMIFTYFIDIGYCQTWFFD